MSLRNKIKIGHNGFEELKISVDSKAEVILLDCSDPTSECQVLMRKILDPNDKGTSIFED